MAKFTFNLPDIGEGIAEAEIVEWHVKVGDTIEEDAALADVMTDKATIDLESPVSGTVLELAGEAGDIIAVGGMLVVVEVEGEAPERKRCRRTHRGRKPRRIGCRRCCGGGCGRRPLSPSGERRERHSRGGSGGCKRHTVRHLPPPGPLP